VDLISGVPSAEHPADDSGTLAGVSAAFPAIQAQSEACLGFENCESFGQNS